MQKAIKIKPHHFIDIIMSFAEEKIILKPHPYEHAVHTVTKMIIEDKNLLLEIELGADDICQPCIHNINGICDDTIDTSFRPNAPSLKQEWNLQVDKNWCKKLGIKQGDKISVNQFCEILKKNEDNLNEVYKNVPPNYVHGKEIKLKAGLKRFSTSIIEFEE